MLGMNLNSLYAEPEPGLEYYYWTSLYTYIIFGSSTIWDRSTTHPQVRPDRGSNS